jgi:chromosome segregation ATPase
VLTLKKAGTTGGTQQSQQQGENVMTQVKISEETLKALGATAGDVEDKIKALIAANAKAQTDLDAAQASASEFTVKIEAIEGRLKAVEARKLEVSAEVPRFPPPSPRLGSTPSAQAQAMTRPRS